MPPRLNSVPMRIREVVTRLHLSRRDLGHNDFGVFSGKSLVFLFFVGLFFHSDLLDLLVSLGIKYHFLLNIVGTFWQTSLFLKLCFFEVVLVDVCDFLFGLGRPVEEMLFASLLFHHELLKGLLQCLVSFDADLLLLRLRLHHWFLVVPVTKHRVPSIVLRLLRLDVSKRGPYTKSWVRLLLRAIVLVGWVVPWLKPVSGIA
jgi:hypothetical protein